VDEVTEQMSKHGALPDDHVIQCTRNLCDAYHFDEKDWARVYAGTGALGKKALQDCQTQAEPNVVVFEDTEEGLDMYKGEFSLAYGTLTLAAQEDPPPPQGQST
jgi:hypothetical protein